MKKYLLLSASILLACLIMELWVRVFIVTRRPYELPLFEAREGGLSYRLRPKQYFETRMQGRPTRIETGAWGNVGPFNIPPERDADRLRIAVLGDSFAFGLWADEYRRSMIGVAAALTETQRIEWVNFSVPGYGYSDMRLRLERDIVHWQPDLVLLCTFNGNDFRESFLGPRQMIENKGLLMANRALRRERIPANLLPNPKQNPLAPVTRPLRQWSQTINLLSHLISGPRARASERISDFLETLPLTDNFLSFAFWSRSDSLPIRDQAIDTALQELEALVDFCRARGWAVAVVTIPYPGQVYVETQVGANYDVRYPQAHVHAFCAQKGIAYLDLLPPLRRAARTPKAESLYVQTDPHFSNAGHALSGHRVADFVRSLDLPQKGR